MTQHAICTLAANPKDITEWSVVKGTGSEQPDSEQAPGKRRNLVWKGSDRRSQSVWAVTKKKVSVSTVANDRVS